MRQQGDLKASMGIDTPSNTYLSMTKAGQGGFCQPFRGHLGCRSEIHRDARGSVLER